MSVAVLVDDSEDIVDLVVGQAEPQARQPRSELPRRYHAVPIDVEVLEGVSHLEPLLLEEPPQLCADVPRKLDCRLTARVAPRGCIPGPDKYRQEPVRRRGVVGVRRLGLAELCYQKPAPAV